jgi:hypothetical protein
MTAAVIFSLEPNILRYELAEKEGSIPPTVTAAAAVPACLRKDLLDFFMATNWKLLICYPVIQYTNVYEKLTEDILRLSSHQNTTATFTFGNNQFVSFQL